ncbi:LppM family (lipo)protein [Myceligenerans salitolerans]|uniref:Doublecortin domain-containing protein n=1 Tax=Myceligenerans salitolerans TaxID=1230528 RepID=A0ABS3IA68_9MICO|nr:hypothetical protein [Myceligenerans salitolerans]MBO0609328.1 hypothetical protein [Myceligenerans salitolerans]
MNHARRIFAAAALTMATLLLAGCIKMDMTLTVNGDDTVDGDIVVAVSDATAETMGATPEELLEQADADSIGEDASDVKPYAEDGFTGKRFIFEKSPIEDFSDGEMSIVRDGDEFVVEGSLPMKAEDLDMTEEELADPATQQVLAEFAVNVSFTFPGEIVESNGEVDGNTVTWTAEVGKKNAMTARASALTADEAAAEEVPGEDASAEDATTDAADDTEASAVDNSAEQEGTSFWGSLPGMMIIGAGIGLALGLVLTLVRTARNRKTPAAEADTPPAPATEPVDPERS